MQVEGSLETNSFSLKRAAIGFVQATNAPKKHETIDKRSFDPSTDLYALVKVIN